MTASNPCCLKCNGYRSEKYPKRPECNDQYCPCHKETPAAVEVEMVGVGCEYCANLPEETQKKLHPTQRASIEERVKDSIARYEKSKAEGTLDRDYPVIGRIEPTPQPAKDIEENLRLMNHGIIYQQPEKPPPFSLSVLLRDQAEQYTKGEGGDAATVPSSGGGGGRGRIVDPQPEKEWWEESFDEFFEKLPNKEQVILQGNGSWDFTDYFKEATKALASRIAAQSEKKGRESAVDYLKKEGEEAVDGLWYITRGDMEAARSSEEGKTV